MRASFQYRVHFLVFTFVAVGPYIIDCLDKGWKMCAFVSVLCKN